MVSLRILTRRIYFYFLITRFFEDNFASFLSCTGTSESELDLLVRHICARAVTLEVFLMAGVGVLGDV